MALRLIYQPPRCECSDNSYDALDELITGSVLRCDLCGRVIVIVVNERTGHVGWNDPTWRERRLARKIP